MPPVFTFAEIEAMADALLKKGLSPRRVRLRLAEQGLRWEYLFVGAGRRERIRRLRQAGKTLCTCGEPMTIGAETCFACLERKWSPQSSALPVSL